MNPPSKETMAKYLQQLHWNKVLCEKSVITQREYLKIANMMPDLWAMSEGSCDGSVRPD